MTERNSAIELLRPSDWHDYALLDSGDGMRLERFGAYTLARPDPEALWRKRLSGAEWAKADATFHHGEGAERWTKRTPIPTQWPMHYRALTFFARLTPFKHTGVFPEQAALWDWMRERLAPAVEGGGVTGASPPHILTLFGYTGLAALTCASAGAAVTYVDASRWTMDWARENQRASGLADKPVRWIVDDALKFVKREARRGVRYDAIVLDPPSFGRGPKGEVWKFEESLPPLLDACAAILSDSPLFVSTTAYAVEVSSLALANLLGDALGRRGQVSAGELVLQVESGGRQLSTAIVATWTVEQAV
jgi:23S rRNA (cytosine1962-C5)-methyltransferase